jgi:hypothetical protein
MGISIEPPLPIGIGSMLELGAAVFDIDGVGSVTVDVELVAVGGIGAVVVEEVMVAGGVTVPVPVGEVMLPTGGIIVPVPVPVTVLVGIAVVLVGTPVEGGGIVAVEVPVVEVLAVLLEVPSASMFGSVDSPQCKQRAAEARHSGT